MDLVHYMIRLSLRRAGAVRSMRPWSSFWLRMCWGMIQLWGILQVEAYGSSRGQGPSNRVHVLYLKLNINLFKKSSFKLEPSFPPISVDPHLSLIFLHLHRSPLSHHRYHNLLPSQSPPLPSQSIPSSLMAFHKKAAIPLL